MKTQKNSATEDHRRAVDDGAELGARGRLGDTLLSRRGRSDTDHIVVLSQTHLVLVSLARIARRLATAALQQPSAAAAAICTNTCAASELGGNRTTPRPRGQHTLNRERDASPLGRLRVHRQQLGATGRLAQTAPLSRM